MRTSRALTHWLPVLLWAALIFAFSSIPSLSSGLGVWDTVLRKGAHMTEYAVLAFLLARALASEAPAFVAGLLYAASDELHQSFVRGRHSSPVDVAIDAVGLTAGILAWRHERKQSHRRSEQQPHRRSETRSARERAETGG